MSSQQNDSFTCKCCTVEYKSKTKYLEYTVCEHECCKPCVAENIKNRSYKCPVCNDVLSFNYIRKFAKNNNEICTNPHPKIEKQKEEKQIDEFINLLQAKYCKENGVNCDISKKSWIEYHPYFEN